jgi:hypothetical protein
VPQQVSPSNSSSTEFVAGLSIVSWRPQPSAPERSSRRPALRNPLIGTRNKNRPIPVTLTSFAQRYHHLSACAFLLSCFLRRLRARPALSVVTGTPNTIGLIASSGRSAMGGRVTTIRS